MYKEVSPNESEDMATEVNRQTIATGPVAKYLEDPKKAATATGNKAAYSPYTGGTSANVAYAIDCGIMIIAIVVPAIISLKRYSLVIKDSGSQLLKFNSIALMLIKKLM